MGRKAWDTQNGLSISEFSFFYPADEELFCYTAAKDVNIMENIILVSEALK